MISTPMPGYLRWKSSICCVCIAIRVGELPDPPHSNVMPDLRVRSGPGASRPGRPHAVSATPPGSATAAADEATARRRVTVLPEAPAGSTG